MNAIDHFLSAGFSVKNIRPELESREYGAADFELDGRLIKFRVAKITPTKIGQFVTFWKRIGKGPIAPYDLADSFDFLIVSVKDGERFGQFVFPKSVLAERGIISRSGVGGKRAMRVYPSWDKADNPQAKKTQVWQLLYFYEGELNCDQTFK
ncbi:MAG: MepB family protein [Chlamydiales bacterium]|nr:MepB family protein [Chlamydiales bacterium]